MCHVFIIKRKTSAFGVKPVNGLVNPLKNNLREGFLRFDLNAVMLHECDSFIEGVIHVKISTQVEFNCDIKPQTCSIMCAESNTKVSD